MSYAFYQNRECEYFPCHKGVKEEDFNCLFCYCPLYALGSGCKGDYVFLENGIKDCSACVVPHERKNYDYVNSRYQEIAALIRDREARQNAKTVFPEEAAQEEENKPQEV